MNNYHESIPQNNAFNTASSDIERTDTHALHYKNISHLADDFIQSRTNNNINLMAYVIEWIILSWHHNSKYKALSVI